MTQDYRQRPSDFHAHGIPTLQPGNMGQAIYVEQFEGLSTKDLAKPYLQAMEWPEGWATWNPVAALRQTYADAGMRCGVLGVHNLDSAGGLGLAAKLRPWPTIGIPVGDYAWRMFARIGLGPSSETADALASEPNYGLVVSTTNLLPAVNGPLKFVGSDNGSAAMVSSWTNATTRASKSQIGVLSSQLYAQLVGTYNSVSNVSTIFGSVSDDGVGFQQMAAGETPAPPDALWTLSGPPRVFGIAATQDLDVGVGTPFDIDCYCRLDYVALFVSPVLEQTGSEGGRSFYG